MLLRKSIGYKVYLNLLSVVAENYILRLKDINFIKFEDVLFLNWHKLQVIQNLWSEILMSASEWILLASIKFICSEIII